MILENLGHETWLATSASGSVLVDALLHETFGRNKKYQYRKLRHANLTHEALTEVSTVILTTEHFQHYHLASLLGLPSLRVVYISETFSAKALDELRNAGITTTVCKLGDVTKDAGFAFVFLPADGSAMACDSRVSSLMLADASTAHRGPLRWCFIQSDAPVCKKLVTYIPSAWRAKPDVVIVVSHFREFDESGFSPWESYLHPRPKIAGLSQTMNLLSQIMPVDIAPLNVASLFLISGGEYEPRFCRLPSPRRNNHSLAEVLRAMLVNARVQAVQLGSAYVVGHPGTELPQVLPSLRAIPAEPNHAALPTLSPFDIRELVRTFTSAEDRIIADGLKWLATALLLSPLGHQLLLTNRHLGRDLDSRRFALKLINGDPPENYEFCFARSAFVRSTLSDLDLIMLPAGITMTKDAFYAIVTCEASPAEVLTHDCVQWYCGDMHFAPLGLIYSAFSDRAYRFTGPAISEDTASMNTMLGSSW